MDFQRNSLVQICLTESLLYAICFPDISHYVLPQDLVCGASAEMKEISPFETTQLKQMKIKFPTEGSGQSHAPQRSQTHASQPVTHEAQSAPPPLPANFDQRIREIMDAALARQTVVLRSEFDIIRADIKLGIMDVLVAQTEVLSNLTKLKEDIEEQGANLGSTLFVTLSALRCQG